MHKKTFVWIAAAILLIIIVVGVGYLLFNGKVTDTVRTAVLTYLRNRVSESVATASAGKVEVTFDDFDYGFFTRMVSIKGVSVSYHSVGNGTKEDYEIEVEEISCSGVSPWDVLNGGGLSIGTVRVLRPVVNMSVIDSSGLNTNELDAADTAIVRLPKIPDVDSLLNDVAMGALPTNVAPLSIDAVEVIDAKSTNTQQNDTASMRGEVNGFELVIRDISLGTGERVSSHILADITVKIHKWRRTFSTGRDVVVEGASVKINDTDSMMSIAHTRVQTAERDVIVVRGVLFSFASRKLTIDSVSLGTLVSDKEWLASLKHPADRFKIAATKIAMEEIDLSALTLGTALTVRNFSIGTLMLDVFSSHLGTQPRVQARQLMPHQLMREIPFNVGIETLAIADITLRYAEQQRKSPTPGVLTWSKVQASVLGLNSNPAEQAKKPLTVSAKGLFLNVAAMAATFTFPLNVDTYEMYAEGSLQKLDIRKLNSFLPAIEGIRITSGTADGASFKISVKGRTARGFVDPIYRDLDIELVDKKTKKGNFFTGALSFIASWLVVNNDNPPGEDHKVGKIAYTVPRNAALMQTIWFPIRAGLGDVAGF